MCLVRLCPARTYVCRDARPVVRDTDQPAPAVLNLDDDALRPGVEGVLKQLFYDRGRPLDHFARGDLSRDIGWEKFYWHGTILAHMVSGGGGRNHR